LILYKSNKEIDIMRKSGRIVAEVLHNLAQLMKPGLSTWDLEEAANDYLMTKHPKATPAFKGYMDYPASLCVSVNQEVVHGIPSKTKIIEEGDIVSIDFGVFYEGYAGDSAITVPVGKNVSKEALELMKATQDCLIEGIKYAKVGAHLHDISCAIQSYIEVRGYSVIRDLVGHGIGRDIHEAPQVPNFGEKGTGVLIEPGLTIAIEPMVAMGNYEIDFLNDGWTAVTRDGSLSAHFEHTIVVINQGTFILTEC
jgi:methionyl aminopeptidase